MGHQRLGKIPKSKPFAQVVALISGNAETDNSEAYSVEAIAAATLTATRAGLQQAKSDSGLCDIFYFLTQVVLAARDEDNWRTLFKALGISLSDNDGMFEFASELQSVIQDRLDERNIYSDVSEMARKSAIEAVKSLVEPYTTSLFDTGPEELRAAVSKLATKKGFSSLGRVFFGRLLGRYLNFYICKETPNALRNGRLNGIEGLCEFEEALDLHCYQSARIVEEFCGDWYSKTQWREGIDYQNTSRAVAFAIEKLQRELSSQGEGK